MSRYDYDQGKPFQITTALGDNPVPLGENYRLIIFTNIPVLAANSLFLSTDGAVAAGGPPPTNMAEIGLGTISGHQIPILSDKINIWDVAGGHKISFIAYK